MSLESAVDVRPMRTDDVEAADHVMRLAFGTIRGLPDPSAAFGDADSVRTRFRAAPEYAWVAEHDGDVVGSVFAARWGSFGFLGPLSVDPGHWDRGIGGRLLQPVLGAFASWNVRQAGPFTFADSPKHLRLYQRHGFWPGSLTVVTAKEVGPTGTRPHALFSNGPKDRHDPVLDEIRGLTDEIFDGLDIGSEIVAVNEQGIGDTVLLHSDRTLEGMAVCHCGAGSEAGSDTCYVKFAAVRPGARVVYVCQDVFHQVAGVNTGRLAAYRRLLVRGHRAERIGVSMRLRPEGPHFDTPAHYVIDDLR